MNLRDYFLNEPKPFTSKRDVNWNRVQIWAISTLSLGIFLLLLLPEAESDQITFHEKAQNGSLKVLVEDELDPTQETLRQLRESQVNMRQVHGSLDHLYRSDSITKSNNGRNSSQNNTSMILTRGGTDTRTQLSAGTKVVIRLTGKVVIAKISIPIVGIVSSDVNAENGIAIARGAKVLGNATFDEQSERASITWQSIILPDGRERPFSAIALGDDGQTGINGQVHSEGIKNAIGQTITRFVGAYASGSMKTGMLGSNEGGHKNGLRNAIAQTAADQTNEVAEDLKKERKWIEIDSGSETIAILNQPFTFRDAGATYGQ
ncbi:MAG: TrbI/VirB10 family protein [Halobacteriovoraceae bacterium]|nr:TrbI/VirB10 family protein [Halobacteriovoraceae bacterium]MCB9093499.1 TrbI/VirB10 family protein [Halobacteriovoraceae bacterium]